MKVKLNWTGKWYSRHEAYGWQVLFLGPLTFLWGKKGVKDV